MPSQLDCPDRECWQALLSVSLPPDEQERCEQHLESCAACQQRLCQDSNDALLELARQFGDPTLLPADPVLIEVLGRLHEGKSTSAARHHEPPDLYFLSPSDRPELLGTLGAYEVEEVIGQGGMGVVLKAHDPSLNRPVAIKVMSAVVAGSAVARQRFQREAKAAASVCHEHIVTVHGVHDADGLPYLVMQYVAGESLQARLDRTGPLETMEVFQIGLQTAHGLAAAHARGLIHRDIKPANLLLQESEGCVKIADFGLARMTDDVQLTQNDVVAGTPEYMAPEQARGEAVDHRADLFSLGSVLYAACTGVPPFRGASSVAVLRQVSDEPPPSVRALNPEVPAWLEALIVQLMAKKPTNRFQTATEVAELLEGYLAHLRQPLTVPAPELPLLTLHNPKAPSKRRLLPWLVALVFLVVSAGGVAWRLMAGAGPENPPRISDKQPAQERQVFDFGKGVANLPPCVLFGPNTDSLVSSDAKGLRINRPASEPNTSNIGVDVPLRLHGDFDISVGYELLTIGQPLPTYGAGIGMRVVFAEPSPLIALISRSRKPVGELFGTFKIIKEDQGKERYGDSLEPKAASPNGRLRLVRTGSTLYFFVADGGVDYKGVRSMDVGTDDVSLVRIYSTTTGGALHFDMRLSDLDIRADKIGAAATTAADSSPVPPENTKSRTALVAALVVGAILTLLAVSGLGAWFAMRRNGAKNESAEQEFSAGKGTQSETVAPIISFACGACGKSLKAKARLAGKKVKCSQCGQVALVPAS